MQLGLDQVRGITTAERIAAAQPHTTITDLALRTRVFVRGIVTHRQAPETTHGILFLNVEDETGLANIVLELGLRLA